MNLEDPPHVQAQRAGAARPAPSRRTWPRQSRACCQAAGAHRLKPNEKAELPSNWFRRVAHRLSINSTFEFLMIGVVLANMVCLAMKHWDMSNELNTALNQVRVLAPTHPPPAPTRKRVCVQARSGRAQPRSASWYVLSGHQNDLRVPRRPTTFSWRSSSWRWCSRSWRWASECIGP